MTAQSAESTGAAEGAARAEFSLSGRNPDVLSCIANLSNDEVFTPPELANDMLDLVAEAWAESHDGADIWADPQVTFLDPVTKSGVFLREITKRLVAGLEPAVPGLQERVDHILANQVFGIGITTLTAMLARRSLYCSKWANGEFSVAKVFDEPDGNIWFERTEHAWEDGKCRFCRASQGALDRGDELETHAYAFIHTDDINARIAELFGDDMEFDVIIGNPPYQMTGGGGGTNDSAIYHRFVEQAIQLDPRYLCMVIPSRWMAGGRGVDKFRAAFLADRRVRNLVDYENAKDVFPTVGIGGGACYFLRDSNHDGQCDCTFNRGGKTVGPTSRALDEFDVFVRDPRSLAVLRKVTGNTVPKRPFSELVSGDTPFGLATNFVDYSTEVPGELSERQALLYANCGTKRLTGVVNRELIRKNVDLVDVWKLILPVAGSGRERERTGVDLVLGPSIVAAPGSVCTQTYLVAGPFESQYQVDSASSYLRTRFARFLISLRKPAQHVFRSMYAWVPQQTWDQTWTDEELYEKYGLTDDEIEFIEAMIRPMELADG